LAKPDAVVPLSAGAIVRVTLARERTADESPHYREAHVTTAVVATDVALAATPVPDDGLERAIAAGYAVAAAGGVLSLAFAVFWVLLH
jgi:hypothetical protein